MENEQDFVIKDGVLTGYTGPGGDVTAPESAAEISGDTFSEVRQEPAAEDAILPEDTAADETGALPEDTVEAEEIVIPEAGEDLVSEESALTEDAVPAEAEPAGEDTAEAVETSEAPEAEEAAEAVEEVSLEPEQDTASVDNAFSADSSPAEVEAVPEEAEEIPAVPAESEGKQAFVIENGILTEYNGPGGDVVIPEGVTDRKSTRLNSSHR